MQKRNSPAKESKQDLSTATATLKADYQIVPPGTDTPDARLTDPMPPSQMIRTTDKKDDEDSTCSDGNGWDFDEIELGEQEDDADDDDEEDDENRPSEDESKEKENMAASPPKGASLKSAMGILSPSSFEIRQNARRLLDETSKRRRSKRRQSTSVLRRPLQPSSLVNRMASNRDNSKGVGKETQAQSSNNALRRLQSELGLEFGATCSVNAISAEIDADLAEIKEAAQEMANTFIEVGEDAIGMVKDGISGVGSLFDGLMNGPTLETTGGA